MTFIRIIYQKNSLKKLRLSEQKKYILVAGSGVTFNRKKTN